MKHSWTMGLMIAKFIFFSPLVLPATAQISTQLGSETGLPLGRYGSLVSDEVNVRRGPGDRYAVSWTFIEKGLPVEITREFGNWFKIRDYESNEGWIHRQLISNTKRTALVTPWSLDESTNLHQKPDIVSKVSAQLDGFVLVNVRECDGDWCNVFGTYSPNGKGERNARFEGWITQGSLWGVQPLEKFE